MADNKKIKIKLVRSLIGCTEKQRRIVNALGLTKRTQEIEHDKTPVIMGMVNAVPHLLEIAE